MAQIGMLDAQLLGHQRLHWLAEQFVATIAERLLHILVQKNDARLVVDHDQTNRQEFEGGEIPKPCFGPFQGVREWISTEIPYVQGCLPKLVASRIFADPRKHRAECRRHVGIRRIGIRFQIIDRMNLRIHVNLAHRGECAELLRRAFALGDKTSLRMH